MGERLDVIQVVHPRTLIQHRGPRRPRAHRVCGHPGRAELDGQGADQTRDARFGCAVRRKLVQTLSCRSRGNSDESAAARLRSPQQRGHRDTGEVEHAAEVDVDHGLLGRSWKIALLHAAGDHAGARDGGVEPTPVLFGSSDGRGERVGITNIGDEELIVMLWANEVFNREQPDTIAMKVKP